MLFPENKNMQVRESGSNCLVVHVPPFGCQRLSTVASEGARLVRPMIMQVDHQLAVPPLLQPSIFQAAVGAN